MLTLGAYATIAAMAFVYWGQARLRASYDFFLIVPAAVALEVLLLRLRGAPGSGEDATRAR